MAGGPSSKKSSKKRRARRRRTWNRNPAAELPDDLLLEILARVPYSSLCRFRCVSKRWSALISDPKNRERLPQTLAGFFYRMLSRGSTPHSYGFLNVSGTGAPFIDPSSFLPDSEREGLELVDCCNGLILSRSVRFADNLEFHYLVLNPATKKWVAVPVTWSWSNKVRMARLGFDPAVSPHFYVFEFQSHMKDDNNDSDEDDGDDDSDEDDGDDDSDGGDSLVLGVKIYSSATGVWIHKQSDWSTGISLQLGFKSVFLDGVLYVIAVECVIGAVDVDGRTWRVIKFPRRKDFSSLFDTAAAAGFIDLSQGQLHFVKAGLAVWVLENKDSKKWTLKETGRFKHLVRTKNVVAIHPDRNMVFFVFGCERTLKSYDMDSRKECIICNLGSWIQ